MVMLFYPLMIFILLAGCQVGPPYQAPSTYAPREWKHKAALSAEPKESLCNWWKVFGDEPLNTLEQQALANNKELYAAMEKVLEARALAQAALSNLYPQISLSPSYSNQEILAKLFGAKPPAPTFLREHQITNQLPVSMTYEVDLWGMLYSNYQAAYYYAQFQDAAFRAALLILTTDLADSYFRLRILDAKIDLYFSTIETRKTALEINQARYQMLLVDYESVSRAALDLTNVEADYFEAIRQRNIEENRIALLIGSPASDFNFPHSPLDTAPPNIPAGIPSDVLLQRPDIAAAERMRASENAQVKVAYAAFFPSFSLTAALGFSSPDLKHFLTRKSRYWALGGAINQSLFDGGQRVSNLELACAHFREADDEYQQQVLIAFQEVEDALGNLEQYHKEAEKLKDSVGSATTTYTIAYDRYSQGVTFYLDVVDSERDLLNARRNLLTVEGLQFTSVIQLIKALGGAWQPYSPKTPF